ncbi:putative tRNA N6-adenosine threonylcarbamoyltransferase [Cucumis melo var. makuwa]|uniref:tRNA N6-adenosine threonylcarbamoyltransferase n=1 Tax=Cucumis melo var. makuwa TaxID=1194695 RepID=A0A5D3DV00_CUCMM|nr:putative tRNA N6-adenosine threonylcarbamoyltransferase [Cucumis melo var. makuwa]TYK27342.1 putative tRNA N6-adenosine threonylcarbamoyltransferase [Cucumis melo var. makuwa]
MWANLFRRVGEQNDNGGGEHNGGSNGYSEKKRASEKKWADPIWRRKGLRREVSTEEKIERVKFPRYKVHLLPLVLLSDLLLMLQMGNQTFQGKFLGFMP